MFANPDVLGFYRELPFNYRQSVRDHARAIRHGDATESYPILAPLLHQGTSVLDVGCGAGWFSLNAAYHHRCRVTGIDFNQVALERAREVAHALGVAVKFQTADLFQFESAISYDLVVSLGVLHHTNDCHMALRRLCARYVKPGGHVFVGLYHRHGRRPFLEHFRQLKAVGATEVDMLERYRRLHSTLTDETHLKSWFRDQVLHPHETQHTLRELFPVLEAAGMILISTSINGFARFDRVEELFAAEPNLEQVAAQRLTQNQYYPGFFVFLARKV
jgi:2-polyprenyl-3-methyl-5-hydroxy-6-metoxy-1,4-benzoquinol methylase